MTVIPVVVGSLGTVPKSQEKKSEGIENQREYRECPDRSIVSIVQNTKKNPGDKSRFDATQSTVKDPISQR